MEQDNATRAFLGDEAHWSAARVELYDVQGLWGGRRISVAGPKQVVVRRVLTGRLERRYEFDLNADEWKRLLDSFVEYDFVTIKPMERPGIPDEARPTITLVNVGGEKCVVAKWAGVKDERFDAVYSAMMRLEAFTAHLEPVYSGPYDLGT